MLTTLFTVALAAAPIEFEACRIGGESSPRLDAQCATYMVPENHDAPEGRQIELRIARLKARTNDPAKEPLVFIAGGPGQSAIESFPGVSSAFEKVRQQRPILLVDQRGTGESHPLACEMGALGFSDSEEEAAILEWAQSCLASFDADPRFYSTFDAIRDLEVVRQALGVDHFMLYGISYGSRVAQEYLRRYPDALAGVVIDGVAAPQEALGLDIATDAQAAFDAMLGRCAETEKCKETYPDLRARFATFLNELEGSPVKVEVEHPHTGKKVEVEIAAADIAGLVRLSSYSRETMSVLPLQLEQAIDGDFSSVGAALIMLEGGFADEMAMGMHMAVICHEDAPFYPDDAGEESKGTYLGAMTVDFLKTTCTIWPVRNLPDDIKSPVESDVPVLLLSGEFDPVTPPSNAVKAAQKLSNSRHVVAPGQGHGVAWQGCLPNVVAEFYKTLKPEELDTDCASNLEASPFFIDLNGPTP